MPAWNTSLSSADLTALDLRGTDVTDAGLEKLSHIASLRDLNLSHCRFTDKGLAQLKALAAPRAAAHVPHKHR